MENQPTPPWAKELTGDEFISYGPTYKVGEHFSLYKKKTICYNYQAKSHMRS